MWKSILNSVLSVVSTRLPWEMILANLSKYIFQALQSRDPEKVENGKRYVAKASEQLMLISAAIEDNDITTEEVQDILNAWAAGNKTPESVSKLYK